MCPSAIPPHLRGLIRLAPGGGFVSIPSNVSSSSSKQAFPTPPIEGSNKENLSNKEFVSNNSAVHSPVTPNHAVDPFAAFLAKKTDADLKAKKAAMAQKSQQSIEGPAEAPVVTATSPWGQPPPTRTGGVRHEHFEVNIDGVGVDGFQAFMQKKKDGSFTNGKRYSAALVSSEKGQKQTGTPISEFELHAKFKPNSIQQTPALMQEGQKQSDAPAFKIYPHAAFSPCEWQPATPKTPDAQAAP